MKCIYPLAILALATTFSGCSSDDKDHPYVKGDTDSAITFSNPFINNSVKQRAASATTKETLEGFRVWGFVVDPSSVVFDGAPVEREGDGWEIKETEYWYLGQPYWFTAISTGDFEESKEQELYTFTPIKEAATDYQGGGTITYDNKTADGEKDLIYAFSDKVIHDNLAAIKPVGLTFDHLLSQIFFQFTNNISERTILEIENLTFNGVVSSGSIDMTAGTDNARWTIAPDTFAIRDIDTKAFGFNDFTKSEASYIIPTDANKKYTIQFTAVVKIGTNVMDRYKHTITLPATAFEKGRSYIFKANLNAQNIDPDNELKKIEFTVDAVNDWGKDEEVTLPVPNE